MLRCGGVGASRLRLKLARDHGRKTAIKHDRDVKRGAKKI